jgi:hypothetical protein
MYLYIIYTLLETSETICFLTTFYYFFFIMILKKDHYDSKIINALK